MVKFRIVDIVGMIEAVRVFDRIPNETFGIFLAESFGTHFNVFACLQQMSLVPMIVKRILILGDNRSRTLRSTTFF